MRRRTFLLSSLTAGFATVAGGGLPGLAPGASAAGLVESVIDTHPRLLLRDFEGLRATVAGSEQAAGWYAKVRADADAILSQPVSEYEIPDGLRLLDTSREVVRRTYSLATTYAVDGEAAHAERLWAELEAAAHFPDWNSARHFLDTAEMTHAFAIGYDWLYDVWTPERRETLRTAIRDFGLRPGLAVYASSSGWHTGDNNWNIVCNSGLTLGALALAQDEPEISGQVLDEALASVPRAIAVYGPDGGYPEGLGSYWGYATKYLVPFIESLRTATGDDHGLAESPGLAETGLFPIHLTGPAGENFNYYDAGGGSPQPPEMFWLARQYGNAAFGWWGRLGGDRNPVSWFQSPAGLLWYDPDKDEDPIEANLGFDHYFRRCEVVTMRSGWEDREAVFTGFKGGDNSTNHGNLDLGDFVLDALGSRFASELGGDDYNLPGYFSGGPGGQRWTYYRNRAEGQNTLVVNPGSGMDGRNEDQVVTAVGTVIAHEAGVTAAYAVADLSAAHPDLSSWRRGVRQFDHRQQVVVQDEIVTRPGSDVWWYMHTPAAISVTADGRSATLERAGQRVLARILAPADAVFYNAAPRPLWTSPDPAGQNVNAGLRKLAIRLSEVSEVTVAVQFTPLRAGQDPAPLDTVTPMSAWTTGPETVSRLGALTVDGTSVASFDADNFTYTVTTTPGADLPVVAARASRPQSRVVVHPVRRLPGAAVVDVIEPGRARGRYQVFFRTDLGPGSLGSTIVASADDGNVPVNTMDGDPATRWSAEGDGQWIAYDLGADGPVSGVRIAWYSGDQRTSSFDVEMAAEGEYTWRRIFSGHSSGTTTDGETYTFDTVTARYLRIVGHGNSVNAWNSIAEVTIPGRTVDPPHVTPHLATVTLFAPASVAVGSTTPLRVTGTMSDGSDADLSEAEVSFATADERIAHVDASGTLTALAEGTVAVAGIVVTKDWRFEFGREDVVVEDPTKKRFVAVADTYVNDGPNADVNYGTSSTVLVKNSGPNSPGFNRRGLLTFAPAATSATIASVTLNVYGTVNDSNGTEIDVTVNRLAEPFDERTVTWNTQPGRGERLGAMHVTSTPAWRSVDLTEQLKAAVVAGERIDLLLDQDPAAGRQGLATPFSSRESNTKPYLMVRLEG